MDFGSFTTPGIYSVIAKDVTDPNNILESPPTTLTVWIGLRTFVPAHVAIGAGQQFDFTFLSNPASLNLAVDSLSATLTCVPSDLGTKSDITINNDVGTVTFNTANSTSTGTASIQVGSGPSTVTTIINVMTITSVDWEPVDANCSNAGGAFSVNGGGFYIYPDKNSPADTLHNQVKIKVTLDRPLPDGCAPMTIYLKIFDVDDPTQNFGGPGTGGGTNTADVTDTAAGVYNGNDNRSTNLGGTTLGIAPESGSLVFQPGSQTAVATLTISPPQPGNNWKVVVGFDQTAVNAATINTAVQNGLDKVPSTNDPMLSFKWANGSTVTANQQSSLLSVWRQLHVEIDSMAAVATSGSQSNVMSGTITGVPANAKSATVTWAGGLNDASPNLSGSSLTNGRFENGTMTVTGAGGETRLQGNGGDFVKALGTLTIRIPCILNHQSLQALSSFVVQLNGTVATLSGNIPANNDYSGGTFSVGGAVFTIAAGGAQPDQNTVTATAPITVPFTVRDDDDFNLLPVDVTAGNNGTLLSVLTAALSKAYIAVNDNGGGNPANNQDNAPFILHISGTTTEAAFNQFFTRQSGGTDDFWTAYALLSHQPDKTIDGDPDIGEGPTHGLTWADAGTLAVHRGGTGSYIFMEVIRDQPRPVGRSESLARRIVFAHEVAHQFGLPHWDAEPNLMNTLLDNTPDSPTLPPLLIHLLRFRVKSPGK